MAARRPVNNRLHQPYLKDLTMTNVMLGVGSFGRVFEVKYKQVTCAAKQMHEELVDPNVDGGREIIDKYLRECEMMAQILHPNITQFLGLYLCEGSNLPLLVMEKLLMSVDDILEYSGYLPLPVKLSILTDTSNGLAYMHGLEVPIVHRDLTARNILLTKSLTAKISDLGNSSFIYLKPGQLDATLTQHPGTAVYMAPEAMNETHQYGIPLDIFSFGHLALYTLTQIFPSDLLASTYTDHNQVLKGRSEVERRKSYMDSLEKCINQSHPDLFDGVNQCLQLDPKKRPSARDLLKRLRLKKNEVVQKCGGDLKNEVNIAKILSAKEMSESCHKLKDAKRILEDNYALLLDDHQRVEDHKVQLAVALERMEKEGRDRNAVMEVAVSAAMEQQSSLVESLQNQISTQQHSQQALQAEKDALQYSLNTLERENRVLRNSIERLEDEVRTQRQLQKRSETDNRAKLHSLEILEDENRAQQYSLEIIKKESNEQHRRLALLQTENRDLQLIQKDLKTQMFPLTLEKEELETINMKTHPVDSAGQQIALKKQYQELLRSHDNLKSDNRVLQHSVQRLENENAEQHTRLTQLRFENKRLKADKSPTHEKPKAHVYQIAFVDDELRSCKDTIKHQNAQINQLEDEVRQLTKEVSESRIALADTFDAVEKPMKRRPATSQGIRNYTRSEMRGNSGSRTKNRHSYHPDMDYKEDYLVQLNWNHVTDMPLPKTGFVQSVAINGILYIGGGRAQTGNPHIVLAYNIKSAEWQELLPYKTYCFSMTAMNDKIIVANGYDQSGTISREFGVWDNKSKEWTHPYPPMPNCHSFPSVVFYMQWIVVAGGADVIDVLSIDDNQWSTRPPLPSPSTHLLSTIVGDTWYVFINRPDCLEIYSVSMWDIVLVSGRSNIWSKVPSHGCSHSCPLSMGESLYAIGGLDSNGRPMDIIQRYLPHSNTWVWAGLLHDSIHSCSAALSQGKVYVIGGQTATQIIPSVYEAKVI